MEIWNSALSTITDLSVGEVSERDELIQCAWADSKWSVELRNR